RLLHPPVEIIRARGVSFRPHEDVHVLPVELEVADLALVGPPRVDEHLRKRLQRQQKKESRRQGLRPPPPLVHTFTLPCGHGFFARCRALLMSAMCEYACGKFPSCRLRPQSYCSASRPTSLRRANRRSKSLRASSSRPWRT